HTSAKLLDDNIEQLLAYIRNAVRNDSWSLHTEIHSAGLGPEFWSDSQVLKHLLADEDFAKFYADFHLKLL
ncbi:MAG: hypothetical protein K2L77_08790, partial [Muribaculaceae bacterium]|nr:hypothetical protein [Muribaculaceae bacterium]